MTKKFLIYIAIAVICSINMSAADAGHAAKLYNAGDYDGALNEYKTLVADGADDARVFYDMGNAAFKAGDPGLAVLSYERALRLAPGDKRIDNNLKFVSSKVADANRAELKGKKHSVVPDDKSFFGSLHDTITRRYSSDTWAVWSAVCFVSLIGFVAIYIFSSHVIARKIGFFGSLASLAATVVFLIFAFAAAARFESRDRAVIMSYKVSLLSEPDSESKVSANPLCAGTCVDILDSSESDADGVAWYMVRLNSDYVGWVKASDIEVI